MKVIIITSALMLFLFSCDKTINYNDENSCVSYISDESISSEDDDSYDYSLSFQAMCDIALFSRDVVIEGDTLLDRDFDRLMQRYITDNLSYPKDGEDFCRHFFMVDSLNNYHYLYSYWDEYMEPYLTRPVSPDYHEYNILLDKLLTKNNKRVYTAQNPLCKILSENFELPYIRIIDWRYIYRHRSNISFKENGCDLLMHNTDDGCIYKTDNIVTFSQLFTEKSAKKNIDEVISRRFAVTIEDDSTIIPWPNSKYTFSDADMVKSDVIMWMNEIKKFGVVNVYTSDSIRIDLYKVYHDFNLSASLQHEINRLELGKYALESSSSQNTIGRLILCFHKDGKVTDFFTGQPAPEIYAENEDLKNYMNKLISVNPNISFVIFKAYIND